MKIERNAKTRLLLLAAGLLFVVGSAAGVYACRRYLAHRELGALKAQGIADATAGRNDQAVEVLASYLRRRPDDPEALRAYAGSRVIISAPNDSAAAADVIAVLQSLSQFGPLTANEHHRLMELYAVVGNDSGVTHEADRLLSMTPSDTAALKCKSLALARQHDWTAALATASLWVQAAPLDIDAEICLQSAMLHSGVAPAQVVEHAASLRRAHPGNPCFELLESLSLTDAGLDCESADSAPQGTPSDPRSAAEWARTAAARPQSDDRCAHLLIQQLDRLALFNDSFALLRRQVAGGDSACRLPLARRLWVAQQWTEMADLLNNATTSVQSSDPESQYLYATAMVRLGRGNEAANIVGLLKKQTNDPVLKAWSTAINMNKTPGQDPPSAGQLVKNYENAIASNSDTPFLHCFLAEALVQIGENDLAIKHLEEASAELMTWAAPNSRRSELLLQQGRAEAAVLAAAQAQFRETSSGQPHSLSVAIAMARAWSACLDSGRTNDKAGLDKLVNTVQKLSPGEPQTLSIQISLLVGANNRPGAIAALRSALASAQASAAGVLLEYAAISRGSQLNLEAECFDRYERNNGMTSDLAYALSTEQLASGDARKGLSLFDSSRAKAGGKDDLAWRLARARYLDAARDPGASAAWIALADEKPELVSLQQLALSARCIHSDRAVTDRLIERVHQITGDGAFCWRLARARWLLEGTSENAVSRKDAENASRLLSAMLRVCPDCIDAHVLMATCQQKLQNLDSAIGQLQTAVALLPDSADLSLQLVRMLEQKGDFAHAQSVLRPFTDGRLADPVALVSMGWLLERDGNASSAEQSYRKAIELRPNMAAAQNNLAMILLNEGNPGNAQEALALAGRAASANPGSALYLDTLSAAQGAARDYDGALASISKAIAIDGANAQFKLRRIELLVDAGHIQEAASAMDQIQPLLSQGSSESNKDWNLTNRVRKVQETLALATRPDK